MNDENVTTQNEVINFGNPQHKAALINVQTGIVENIIIVNSFEDKVPVGYILKPITMIDLVGEITQEYLDMIEIIKEIDPDYITPTKEIEIRINETRWSEEKGFYTEEV
jgi:hypothetical protein